MSLAAAADNEFEPAVAEAEACRGAAEQGRVRAAARKRLAVAQKGLEEFKAQLLQQELMAERFQKEEQAESDPLGPSSRA